MSKGKIIGYKRVSSIDQNEARQLEGKELDKMFIDKASGRDNNRPQLQAMLDYVRDGDVILVHSLDRIGRNLVHIKALIEEITGKGVEVQFVKENLFFHPQQDRNPMTELMLNMLGSFAQFERDMIRERQREGIAIAKVKGLYRGRKKTLSDKQVLEIKELALQGVSKNKIAKEYGISVPTLYRSIK
jgi:DNA invertase Pin-like site-specific DNA recombinase